MALQFFDLFAELNCLLQLRQRQVGKCIIHWLGLAKNMLNVKLPFDSPTLASYKKLCRSWSATLRSHSEC